jgi:hypothetical protein
LGKNKNKGDYIEMEIVTDKFKKEAQVVYRTTDETNHYKIYKGLK